MQKHVLVRCKLGFYDRLNKHVDIEALNLLKICINTSHLNLNIKKNKIQKFNTQLLKKLLYQFEA